MENIGWDEGRFQTIQQELGEFFKTVGFKRTEVVYVPVSGMEGENLLHKSTVPELTAW